MVAGVIDSSKRVPIAVHRLLCRSVRQTRADRPPLISTRAALQLGAASSNQGDDACADSEELNRLLDHTVVEVRDPTDGRYEACRVGKCLELSAAEIAQIVGWSSRDSREPVVSSAAETRVMST